MTNRNCFNQVFYKDIADFFDKIREMKEFTRTASRFHVDSVACDGIVVV
jgi:hypothetical protein